MSDCGQELSGARPASAPTASARRSPTSAPSSSSVTSISSAAISGLAARPRRSAITSAGWRRRSTSPPAAMMRRRSPSRFCHRPCAMRPRVSRRGSSVAPLPASRIVLVPIDRAGPALLAVDRDDLVKGATRAARQWLGLDDKRIASGIPASDLLKEDPSGRRERASRCRAGRASARAVARQWQCVDGSRTARHQPRHALPQDETAFG